MDSNLGSKGNELCKVSDLKDSITQLRCNENELKTDWHNMLTAAS